jgi:hypothetical protein
MNPQKLSRFLLLFVFFAAGCVPTATQTEPSRIFSVAVIVDTTTDSVSREELSEILEIASTKLEDLTGFAIQDKTVFEDNQGGTVEDIAQRYMDANGDDLPNGIILFSTGGKDPSNVSRGYSQMVSGPSKYRNAFVPSGNETNLIYVAVVYFNYHYAACGYGGNDTIQSAFPIGDECGGDRSACSAWHGMHVCERALPYLTTPTEMISGVIVHEFMHPFDWEAGPDIHYGSAACNEAMGWPTGYFDNDEGDHFVGMCPYVFENFVNSYGP